MDEQLDGGEALEASGERAVTVGGARSPNRRQVDIDLVTPDALAPTTTDAEIRRWWQSAFDTRVAEFLKS